MFRSNLPFVIGMAAAIVGAWLLMSRPVAAPAWPDTIQGFAFSPLHSGQDPVRGEYPSVEQIDEDLALLARYTRSVRTYSLDGTLEQVPEIAARHGLDVTLGVWLDENRAANEAHIAHLRDVLARPGNVDRVIIGNEVLLREELSVAELATILGAARRELDVPVGTAEPWHLWLRHPELARHVDFIAVHLLPYWEGVGVEAAVERIAAQMHQLEAAFPGKPIVIGEVGWPSFGRSRGNAAASRADAAAFLRTFLERADREDYEYFVLEAFDQPWKRADEGEVGAYWGLFDVQRRAKFDFSGQLDPVSRWALPALASVLLAALVFCLMVADGRGLRAGGRVFLAVNAAVPAVAILWSTVGYAGRYWTALDVLGAVLSGIGVLGMALLMFVEAHEWAEARWRTRRRTVPGPGADGDRAWPKVSIHVPAHEEPPEMLMETLRALAALDYPDFEVVVIDNNTTDESLWRPVEACCARLGHRFRFFHAAPLRGYKAGALNFALERTAADADVVAVVDSDYIVEPRWLRDLVPQLDDPDVAIVQAPQAYRDGGAGVFKTMCDAEYRGFFHIGMLTRNDRNAIIQHGTMTMIRKTVLEEVGGWAEWTITEDAELGLRVLERGYEAVYTPRCYGRGLTPDTFQDYKAQRFRWALGAVQILRRHRRELLGMRRTALSPGQRFHFFSGWLAWLADGCNLIFNAVAVGWSALMILAPEKFPPPLAVLSAFVIALFAFKLVKMMCLYRSEVKSGPAEALGAAIAGLALIHIVGRAVIAGLYRSRVRFCRTPKLAGRESLAGALAAALPEAALAVALLLAALGVAATAPISSIDRTLWCALLIVFAVPHIAALSLSLISVLPAVTRRAPAPRLDAPLTEARRG